MNQQLLSILLVGVTFSSLVGCDAKVGSGGSLQVEVPLPKLNSEPRYFESCAELKEWSAERAKLYLREVERYASWDWGYGGYGAPVSISARHVSSSQTNIQEEGVDEPDIVKTNGNTLYVARTHSVEVISAKELRLIQSLDYSHLKDLKLFFAEGRLAVLGKKAFSGVSNFEDSYVLNILREDRGKLKSESLQEFQGSLVDARIGDGQILLVGQTFNSQSKPIRTSANDYLGTNCRSIQKPILDDFNMTVTTIQRIPITRPSELRSVARFGGAKQIYVTKENLYLSESGYQWFFWDSNLSGDLTYQSQIITKFNWRAKGGPEYLAAGTVLGHAQNVWSFHESNDGQVLHVVTNYQQDLAAQENRLWSLATSDVVSTSTHDLLVVGSTESFGQREDIRSVRFIEDKAYVVTFEKTDPLFTVDLSDSVSPRLQGRLEVPGFSAYLHPVGLNRILGIGYDAVSDIGFSWFQGVQLSLFDRSKPESVTKISQETFGGRRSHSEVTGDHHALYFDVAKQIAAIPVSLLKKSNSSDSSTYQPEIEFSGALVVDLNIGLVPIARLSHWGWVPSSCQNSQSQGRWWSDNSKSFDIRRIVKVKNQLFSVSNFGVKAHEACEDYRVTGELKFFSPEQECTSLLSSY